MVRVGGLRESLAGLSRGVVAPLQQAGCGSGPPEGSLASRGFRSSHPLAEIQAWAERALLSVGLASVCDAGQRLRCRSTSAM